MYIGPFTEEENRFIQRFIKPSVDGNYYLDIDNLNEARKKAKKVGYSIPRYFTDCFVNKLDMKITSWLLSYINKNEKK
jgi:hypothetical protein